MGIIKKVKTTSYVITEDQDKEYIMRSIMTLHKTELCNFCKTGRLIIMNVEDFYYL